MNSNYPRNREASISQPNPNDRAAFLAMAANYLRPYKRLLFTLLVTYALFAIMTAVQPLILAPILDIALTGGEQVEIPPDLSLDVQNIDLNNIGKFVLVSLGLSELSPWTIVIVLAIAYLVNTLMIEGLNFVNYLVALKIKLGAGRDIQVALFRHLFSLSLDFFNRERTGEIMARLNQDTRAAIAGLELGLRNLVVSPLLIAYFGYLMVTTSLSLTIFVAVAAVLHYVLTRAVRAPIRARMRDQFNIAAEATAFIQEKLAAARVVKTFVGEDIEGGRLRKLADEIQVTNYRFGLLKNVDQPATAVINALTYSGILLFTMNELLNGRLTTTGFFLYLFVGRAILAPITTLTQTFNSLQATMAAGIRVRELFAIRPKIVSGSRKIDAFNSSIQFEHVNFAYKDSEVLQDINIEIKKGQTTALVGPSGAGKSTLADLVMRFYDPEKGKILFDGIDLRELDLATYRRQFGVVAQDNILFNATVAENIAYAAPGMTLDEITQAAKVANAHEFIVEFPDGYETYVGDRGVRLSGGQRQRIAIARAVIRNPKILILDEATSSLDTDSEKKVQMAIDSIIHTTTSLVIAHRLSTIKEADAIIVLDRGIVVDTGKHDELMTRCALYARLAKLQFGIATEDGPAVRAS